MEIVGVGEALVVSVAMFAVMGEGVAAGVEFWLDLVEGLGAAAG
jgi:hypothetical protein